MTAPNTPMHPWAKAASFMEPQVVPAGVMVDHMIMEDPSGQKSQTAMITVVTNSGCNTVFLPREALVNHIETCQKILDSMAEHVGKEKLIIATPQQASEVINLQDRFNSLRPKG